MSATQPESWRDWLLTDTPASRAQAAWGRRYRLWRDFQANRLATAGLIVIVVLILASIAAPLLAPAWADGLADLTRDTYGGPAVQSLIRAAAGDE